MALKIKGKDWKEIHELIKRIKTETLITKPFMEYVNDMSCSGATFDPKTGQYVFFDDLVYSTTMDYTLSNLDSNNYDKDWPEGKLYHELMSQLIKLLQNAKTNSKTLKINHKKQQEYLLKWYQDQYMLALSYKPKINLPYDLKHFFGDFVFKNSKHLPGYVFDSTKNKIIEEMINKVESNDLLGANIEVYKYKIYECEKNHLYNPTAKTMLEILFVTLWANKPFWVISDTLKQYGFGFPSSDNDSDNQINKTILNALNQYYKELKFIIFQIWQEILTQDPDNEFVKKIKSIAESRQPYDPYLLYKQAIETPLAEGSREFIDLIAEEYKELLKEFKTKKED